MQPWLKGTDIVKYFTILQTRVFCVVFINKFTTILLTKSGKVA